jgi:hypothetical protein
MILHKSGTRWPVDREFGWCLVRYTSYTWRRRGSQVSWFGSQNQSRWFGDLGFKITIMVYWFRPQTKVGGDLLICASKLMGGWRQDEDMRQHLMAYFVTKQVEIGVSCFASKLAKERRRMMHVASSWRSRGSEPKDSRFDSVECDVAKVGPNYHSLSVIFFKVGGYFSLLLHL